jgi:hypothetical protein
MSQYRKKSKVIRSAGAVKKAEPMATQTSSEQVPQIPLTPSVPSGQAPPSPDRSLPHPRPDRSCLARRGGGCALRPNAGRSPCAAER